VYKCDFCGSAFGDRICYFCEKNCCTSCMIDDRTRCKNCFIYKRRLGWKKLVKKNKVILIFVGFARLIRAHSKSPMVIQNSKESQSAKNARVIVNY